MIKIFTVIFIILGTSNCTIINYTDTYGTKEITNLKFRDQLTQLKMIETINLAKPEFIETHKNTTTLHYHYVEASAISITKIPYVSLAFSIFSPATEHYNFKHHYYSLQYNNKSQTLVKNQYLSSPNYRYKYKSSFLRTLTSAPLGCANNKYKKKANKTIYTSTTQIRHFIDIVTNDSCAQND